MEILLREQFQISRPGVAVNEAAMFVENNIILTQQQSPVYASQLDRFVSVEEGIKQQQISTELWKVANDAKNDLFRLMEEVQIKISKKSKARYQPLDLRDCTWAEVMLAVQETSQRWKGLPQMALGRKCLDKLGQNSEAFQAWIGLLPAGDYGSSICGVFKLAIGAASRYVEVEDSIFNALSDLPEIMEDARKYVQIYRDHRDHLLEQKTFDLYLSILKCLTHIMQFFADSATKRVLGSITRQNTYKNSLTISVEEVKKNASRIKEEAQQCLASRAANMDKNVEFLLENVEDILPEKITEKICQRLYFLMESSPLFNFKASVTQLANQSPIQDMTVINDPRKMVTAAPSNNMEPEKLLELLHHSPKLVSQHLDISLDLGDKLEDAEKSRASAMIQNDKFRNWLVEDAFSSPLLVNGHRDLESAEGPSPFSFVDAQMITLLMRNRQAIVITYFCGMHGEVDHQSRESPTARMMASLVCQLLIQMIERIVGVDISFLTKADLRSVESMELDILCILFRELAFQIPPKITLVCVLDELVLYEAANMERETDAIVRRLTRLVAKSSDLVFKLLITCQGRSLNTQKYFNDKDILDLAEDVEMDDFALWRIQNIGAN